MIADGALIADRYRVISKLGQGGMGQVYLAEHVRMGRKSALKIMNPGMAQDPDSVNRFNREAANASRIAHPNVAAVYDFGETADGLLFLAMEYVDGVPLSAIIEREGALTLRRGATIASQVGEALRIAHRLGIVHRDLKPDNIMVTKDLDGNELVKVVDFGIAKAMQNEAQKVTRTGLSIGTPEYMSPEQLASENVDGRSDIYSLGLVTFAMFTGQLPFPAVTTRETLVARLVDRPARLAAVRPDIAWPSEMQAVMDKVLASNAPERYQDASEFARDLVASLETSAHGATAAAAGAATQVGNLQSGRDSMVSAAAPLTVPATAGRASGGATKRPRLRVGLLVGGMATGLVLIAVAAFITRSQKSAGARRAGQVSASQQGSGKNAGRTTVPPGRRVTTSPTGSGARGASGTSKKAPQTPARATRVPAPEAGDGAAPVAPTPPAVTPPPIPPRVPTLRDSTAAAADDVSVLRRSAATGDRDSFQAAQRRGAILLANLTLTHPFDPSVKATRDDMFRVRDSIRTACQQDPAPCQAVGLSVPERRAPGQRSPELDRAAAERQRFMDSLRALGRRRPRAPRP